MISLKNNTPTLIIKISRLPLKQRTKAIVIETLFRFYITISLFLYALFEVDSALTGITIFMVGISIDIVRNVFSPRLRDYKSNWFVYSIKDCDLIKIRDDYKRARRISSYCGTFYIAILAICAIIVPNKEDQSPPVFIQAFASSSLLTSISDPARRIGVDLVRHGYPHRASDAAFIFIIGSIVFIIMPVIWITGIGNAYANILLQRQISDNEPISLKKALKSVLLFILIQWLPFVMFSNFENIKWGPATSRSDWFPQSNNLSF